ncbi:MAG TPA: hypothetical protein VNJ02_16750 [Vicinamibacterales bacterium]|nr:hypothetical protein [Vicinamibacterales bacterium]
MRSRRTVIVLWLAFAWVAWNVVFDHGVTAGAIEFTRQQVVRHQRGEAVALIEEAYAPRVRAAAMNASLAATAILAIGAAVIARSGAGRRVGRSAGR